MRVCSKRITLADTLASFDTIGAMGEPITASELATELDCPRRTAIEKLDELAERGDVRYKTVGEGERVWWRPVDSESNDQTQFRSLVDAVEEYAIFMLDPDGHIVTWNEGAKHIKGYEEAEIVGEHFSTFYTDEDVRDGVPTQNLAQAREHGQTKDEGWRVREDGSRFWANVTISAIWDDDGTLRGFIKVTRDMTERREYEQRLRQERDLTEELLKTTPVALSVRDADGTLLQANRRAQEVLGLSESEIKEEPDDIDEWNFYDADGNAISPNDSPTTHVLSSGEPMFDEEIAVEKPSGERMWFSVNAAPVFGPDGDLERVVTASEDITELKERERQLETELSEILGRISDAFYALDEEWRFTHVNERAEKIIQRSEAELRGESIWDVFPAATDTVLWEELHEAMETQEPKSFEAYYDALDIWIEVNVYPSETGVSVYFHDISERKEHERALEESEQRYRTLAEHFPNGSVVLFDHDLRYKLVEGTLPNRLDIDPDEFVGRAVGDVHPPEVRETFERNYRAALDGNESSFEVDYDDRVLRIQAIPVRDDDGEVFAGMAMSQDVTEQVEQRRALEESEQRYRALAENFPDGAVGIYDHDLRHTLVEGTIFDELDFAAEDIEGKTVSEVFPPETADAMESLFQAALDGETKSIEVEFSGRIFETWATPVRDADGEVFAGLTFSQDITDRKEREKKLEQFASVVSHDLRNPLGIAQGYLVMARKTGDADDFDEVEEALDRMETIIQSLLTMAREGQTISERNPTSLPSVVESAWQHVETAEATLHVEDPTPTILADDTRLQTAFENLFRNAIEHGKGTANVYIGPLGGSDRSESTDDPSDSSVGGFYVEDDGVGIQIDDTSKVFEYGYSGSGGTGFGLAIVREIVEAHGWEISVTDSESGGARFEIRGVESADDSTSDSK